MRLLLTISAFFILGNVFSQKDTINQKDIDYNKQGYWIIYGKDKPNTGYADSSIIEEGNYKDSRKIGIWKKYHQNGKIKLEATYVNNRPWGKYKKYYDIGVLQERGTFKQNKQVDSFFLYYDNKQLQQQKFFNENGKLEGWSIYYYKNGEVELKIYYVDGKVVDDSTYRAKKYESPGIKEEVIFREPDPKPINPKKRYDPNNQIEYDGEFKDGKLWNGKHYVYDKDGLLFKIEIYKEGKYVGDGQIE